MKSSVGKHLNLSELQHDYIAHNTEQMKYSGNVPVETTPNAECYTKKRLIGKANRFIFPRRVCWCISPFFVKKNTH